MQSGFEEANIAKVTRENQKPLTYHKIKNQSLIATPVVRSIVKYSGARYQNGNTAPSLHPLSPARWRMCAAVARMRYVGGGPGARVKYVDAVWACKGAEG